MASCKLHPMAILSISDHFSRAKAPYPGRSGGDVMGCLAGTYKDGVWEAVTAFGVPGVDGVIDKEYLCETTCQDYKNGGARQHFVSPNGVFPEYDIIGWYRSGDNTATPKDSDSHSIVESAAYESGTKMIMVVLDPNAAEDPELFPITVHAKTDAGFEQVAYSVESNDAEVACVSSLAAMKPRSKPAAVQMQAHMGDLKSAIKMLNSNVSIIIEYLQKVESGAEAPRPALMRNIQALCNRLPAQRKDEMQGPLLTDYNDVLLAAHLAAMTKCCDEAQELAQKFAVFQDNRDTGKMGMLAGMY